MSVDEISGVVIGIMGIPVLIALIILSIPLLYDLCHEIGYFLSDYVFDPIYYAIHDIFCHCVEAHNRRERHKKGGFRN